MNNQELTALARKAYEASLDYALLNTAHKNRALLAIAKALRGAHDEIFKINAAEAQKAAQNGLSGALVDRMTITEARFEEMVSGVEKVAALDDPLNRIYDGVTLPSGLSLRKRSVPLGVVGVIFESRPNVTVDITALCLKSGNACILRGGSECIETNKLLHSIIAKALDDSGINPDGAALIPDPDRALVPVMLSLKEYIAVLIPRGGEKLQRMCQEQSSIPVIIGGFGISHIFVDESADLERAVPVIVNAKVQKPSACNALDTLLVHEAVAAKFIPMVLAALGPYKVKVLAHETAYEMAAGYPCLELGKDEDFDREFLSLTMNLAIVKDVKQACLHLREHRASHSDAILTDTRSHAGLFVRSAQSACVYVNASTRFTDGGQFGLGAEVAISTQKLHARGPMALEALTTYQYVLDGDYLVRS